jgi:hypothetical protein
MMLPATRLLAAALLVGAASLPAQATMPGVVQVPGTGCDIGPISPAPWPLAVTGSASIGGRLTFDPTMPVFTKAVILGAARVDLALDPLFACPCTLVPEPTLVEVGGPDFTFSLSIPNLPSLVGVQLWAQPYYYDGLPYFGCNSGGPVGTFVLGDAVKITIQP